MKPILVTIIAASTLVLYGFLDVRAAYEYERTIGSSWALAEKASTLALKADYIDRFVAAIDSAHLEGHDAILFPTPNNDVASNILTLRSLQTRLREISPMNVKSFEYQQAISQITAQEQGEAHALLAVLKGRWFLQHHPFFWEWIELGVVLLLLTGIVSPLLYLLAKY